VKDVSVKESRLPVETATFMACLATILELPFEELPAPADGEDPARGWTILRWLGGRALGLVPVLDPSSFAWAGPWIARIRSTAGDASRAVVMYGIPSGVAWDPSRVTDDEGWEIEEGFVVAPLDVALARPLQPAAPTARGTVEEIRIAPAAGVPSEPVGTVHALAGRGLEGDRHVTGDGTFPSGVAGSALTMIEAEVCESFDPPLGPDEHRRNVVTRGIELNGLVGHEFTVGEIRCRGMRLCEPCIVVERYASRPILRALVHRGGLRADILEDGTIAVGDPVGAAG
jgi:MOSC domain-containing protein YiiM